MVLRQGDAHWVSPQTIAKAHVLQVKAWVLACCHKPETPRPVRATDHRPSADDAPALPPSGPLLRDAHHGRKYDL